MLSFKLTFSLSSFNFIKRLFSASLLLHIQYAKLALCEKYSIFQGKKKISYDHKWSSQVSSLKVKNDHCFTFFSSPSPFHFSLTLLESTYLSQASPSYSGECSQQSTLGSILLISKKVLFIYEGPKQKLFSMRPPQAIPCNPLPLESLVILSSISSNTL